MCVKSGAFLSLKKHPTNLAVNIYTRKECPFVASDAFSSNSADKGSQKNQNTKNNLSFILVFQI